MNQFPCSWARSNSVHLNDNDRLVTNIDSSGHCIIVTDTAIDVSDILAKITIENEESRSNASKAAISLTSNFVYYWEVEVISPVNSDSDISGVTVGFISSRTKSESNRSFRTMIGSVGYYSSGICFCDKEIERLGSGFGTKDVIGCGLEIGGFSRVFFSCNGNLVGTSTWNSDSSNLCIYPSLELHGIGTTVRTSLNSQLSNFRLSFGKFEVCRIPSTHVMGGLVSDIRDLNHASRGGGTDDSMMVKKYVNLETMSKRLKDIPSLENSNSILGKTVSLIIDGITEEDESVMLAMATSMSMQEQENQKAESARSPQSHHSRWSNDDSKNVESCLKLLAGMIKTLPVVATPSGQWIIRDDVDKFMSIAESVGSLLEAPKMGGTSLSALNSKRHKQIELKVNVPPSSAQVQEFKTNYDSILSIKKTLSELQSKMLSAIAHAPEDAHLDTLLTLNDIVSTTLNYVDVYVKSSLAYDTSQVKPSWAREKSYDTPKSHLISRSTSGASSTSFSRMDVSSYVSNRVDEDPILENIEIPSLVTIMYKLRRGSRSEVGDAVKLLLDMCYVVDELNISHHSYDDAWKDNRVLSPHGLVLVAAHAHARSKNYNFLTIQAIQSAGGLQTLISALPRCADWPDIELHVSKAIALLVAHETEPWPFIKKDVDAILMSLHILLLKGTKIDYSLGSSSYDNDGQMTEDNDTRNLVASAVAQLSLSMCSDMKNLQHFDNSYQEDQSMQSGSLDFRRTLSNAASSSADSGFYLSRALEPLLHIIRTLCPAPSTCKIAISQSSMSSFPQFPPNLSLSRNASLDSKNNIKRGMAENKDVNIVRNSSLDMKRPNDRQPPMVLKLSNERMRTTSEVPEIINSGQVVVSSVGKSMTTSMHKSHSTPVLSVHDVLMYDPHPEETIYVNEVIEDISNSQMTLSSSESPNTHCRFEAEEPVIDDIVIQCSLAISHLSKIQQCQAALVSGGVLPLLFLWFTNATTVLKWHIKVGDNRIGKSEETLGSRKQRFQSILNPVYSLIVNITSTLSFLTSLDKLPSSSFIGKPASGSLLTRIDSMGASNSFPNYTIGWIDAQVIAEGIPSAIINLIEVSTVELSALSAQNVDISENSNFVKLPRSALLSLSETLFSLSSRQQNRSALATSGIMIYFIQLLIDTFHARKTYDSKKEYQFPSEEYGPVMLEQMQRDDLEEKEFLIELITSCLNGLSFFLIDCVSSLPTSIGGATASSAASVLPSPSSISLVNLMVQPSMIEVMIYAGSQSDRGSRLVVLRIISVLVEWPDCLELIEKSLLIDILILTLVDSQNGFDNANVKPVKVERGQSGDDSESQRSTMSNNASNEYVEEIMRACYALASISKYKLVYAMKLFDKGLMKIMLRTAKVEHFEIQRQALKCISAMCLVLSNFTPGVHPSAVVERLQSQLQSSSVGPHGSGDVKKITTAMLHANFTAFVEALRTLAYALESPSSLIQKEALLGVSYLALDEQLSIGIIEGPLKYVIRILVDPLSEPEFKSYAELVLKNIGFQQGKKDLEVVANDSQLLSDWFYMRRSLRPQSLARDLLKRWVDTLFYGYEYAEKRTKHNFILSELGRVAGDIDPDSIYLHLPGGLDIDLRDTLDIPGLSFLRGMLEKWIVPQFSAWNANSTASYNSFRETPSSPTGLGEALLQQYVHLFYAWKMLRNGIPSKIATTAPIPSVTAAELFVPTDRNSYSTAKAIHIDVANSSPSPAVTARAPVRKKSGNPFTDVFFHYMSFCSGRSAVQQVIDEEEAELRDQMRPFAVFPVADATSVITNEPYSKISDSKMSDYDTLGGLYLPPPQIQELLDLFYPSRLHQLYITDMLSIGLMYKTISNAASGDTSVPSDGAYKLAIPDPKNVRALLLPARTYLSFKREGRVIERILEETVSSSAGATTASSIPSGQDVSSPRINSENMVDESKITWKLCFRDSVFHGEFTITMLSTLRRCPQITSLSFACKRPIDDMELGYMGGNVPATVRFLTFESALSSDAIKVLCLKLKTQNWSFLHPINDDASSARGLLGLCIRQHSLTPEDVKYLCELLDPLGIAKNGTSDGRFSPSLKTGIDQFNIFSNVWHASSSPSMYGGSANMATSLYGLRYIDLSYNKLSDALCSNIIRSTVGSPIEAVELGGNFIHKGLYFCDAFKSTVNYHLCRIKYVGFSSNSLTNTTFRDIFESCKTQKTITSIDVSSNALTDTKNNRDFIREFLKTNDNLRNLNLSFNKFTTEITKSLHLGLIENDKLIILALHGNLLKSKDVTYIQEKLKINRDKYVRGHYSYPPHTIGHSKMHHYHATQSFDNTTEDFTANENYVPSNGSTPLPSAIRRAASDARSSSQYGVRHSIHLPTRVAPDAMTNRSMSVSDTTKVERALYPASPATGDADGEMRRLHRERLFGPEPLIAIPVPPGEYLHNTAVATVVNTQNLQQVPYSSDLSTPPSGVGTSSVGSQMQVKLEMKSDVSDNNISYNTLCVLFSTPLAWRDKSNHLHPIETLDYANEREVLVHVFKEAQRDISVRFDFATTDILRSAVTLGCRALHFSGHGHPQCLNFEDGRSGLQFVTVDMLRGLCQAGGLKLEFVFVSACYSFKAGEAFVEAGVPHVVCVNVDAQLLDAAAMAFTRAFYLALAVGKTVSHAFEIGKQAVSASPYVPNSSSEGKKFVLLPRDQPHDSPIFLASSVLQWPSTKASLRALNCDLPDTSHLPQPPEDFEGREVDMHRVITMLHSKRLVTIVGDPGSGKSALCAAVSLYLAERTVFEDGIVYVRLSGVTSYENLLNAVYHSLISAPSFISDKNKTSGQRFEMSLKAKKDNLIHKNFEINNNDAVHERETEETVRDREEKLIYCLTSSKILIVLDHINDLLNCSNGETITDLRMFIGQLFERCRYVKILATSTDSIGIRHVSGFGIVESMVTLGPLSLRSSLRLFARLTPYLFTAEEQVKFVTSLTLPGQANVTLQSRELTPATAQMLYLFGGGHPGKIVKQACECEPIGVAALQTKGEAIVASSKAGVNAVKSNAVAMSTISVPISPKVSSTTNTHQIPSLINYQANDSEVKTKEL